jgi:uncharacterized protein YodC (DUF2158 family)
MGPFKMGDRAKVKGIDGPVMVVIGAVPNSEPALVACHWFVNGEHKTAAIPWAILEPAP